MPSLLKVTPAFTRTLPILTGNKIFVIKVYPLNLISQNQAKHILKFSKKKLRQIGQGISELWSEKQSDSQTNRDYNFIYKDKMIR